MGCGIYSSKYSISHAAYFSDTYCIIAYKFTAQELTRYTEITLHTELSTNCGVGKKVLPQSIALRAVQSRDTGKS